MFSLLSRTRIKPLLPCSWPLSCSSLAPEGDQWPGISGSCFSLVLVLFLVLVLVVVVAVVVVVVVAPAVFCWLWLTSLLLLLLVLVSVNVIYFVCVPLSPVVVICL